MKAATLNAAAAKLSLAGMLAWVCAAGAAGGELPEGVEEPPAESAWGRDYLVKADINTAYLSLGSIISDRGCWFGEIDIVQRLAGFGRLVLGFWTYSDIDNPYTYRRRDWFNEQDPYVFYGCDWEIAEGWRLSHQAGCIYVTLDGYRGEARRSNDETFVEWTYMGELVTPWLTPNWDVRAVQDLGTYVYPGVRREFAVTQTVSLIPHVNFGGGSERWNRNRYGRALVRDRLGAGLQTVNYGMRLEYKLTTYLTVYADLCGFNALNGSVRRQINFRKDAGQPVRADLLHASVGFAAHF